MTTEPRALEDVAKEWLLEREWPGTSQPATLDLMASNLAEFASTVTAKARADAWIPIPEPNELTGEFLAYWPALKLDEDGNLTNIPAGRGYRGTVEFINGQVNGEPEALGACGAFFDDDWEYGDPTHYMELPDAPSAIRSAPETTEDKA